MEFPVLTKEMRSRTRGWKRWLHHGVVATPFVFFVWQLLFTWGGNSEVPMAPLVMTKCWSMLLMVECWVVLLLIPALAAGGIAREVEQHTLMDLLITPLTAWKIVTEKWLSAFMQVLLILAGVIPLAVVWCFVDVSFLALFFVHGMILLAAGFISALSLYISSFCQRLTTATSVVYGFVLSLLFMPSFFIGNWRVLSVLPFNPEMIGFELGIISICALVTIPLVWLGCIAVRFFARRLPSSTFLLSAHIALGVPLALVLITVNVINMHEFRWFIRDLYAALGCSNPLLLLFGLLGDELGQMVYYNASGMDIGVIASCGIEQNMLISYVITQLLLIPMLLHLTAMRIDGMRENQRVEGLLK